MLTVVGAGSAVAASVLFNAGLVLQALEARREPVELGLRLRLVLVLVRRWRWTLGLLLGLAGVGPQVLALSLAPFAVVQPALTVGLLLVLAVGLRTFRERVDTGLWLGVAAIIGAAPVGAFAVPAHAEPQRGGRTVTSGLRGSRAFAPLAP